MKVLLVVWFDGLARILSKVEESTATVFEVKGETLAEHWECTEQMPTGPGTNKSGQLMNDEGDATLF